MSFSNTQLASLILAVTSLLVFAHGFGALFRRFRQPQVIGEILGGLLLGPTVLGHFFPSVHEALFLSSDSTKTVLGAIYQLGLLLLMFYSGMEIQATFQKGEKKTVLLLTIFGTFLPFGLSFFVLDLFPTEGWLGPQSNSVSFGLIFGIAIAITSIPVISRIFSDLGLLRTSFARIVLTAAIFEDVILYVLLTIALGLGKIDATHNQDWFHYFRPIFVTFTFFGLSLVFGRRLFNFIYQSRFNILKSVNTTAFLLIFMLILTATGVFLEISPMLGAFLAGILVRQDDPGFEKSRQDIKNFSLAFFIPIYFAIVGLKLDLIHSFDLSIFLVFLAVATTIKVLSVMIGCKMAGEKTWSSWNFAVAMNARGGPGIVLASVAYDAKLINSSFYSVLVLLAIITSLLAGTWLDFITRKKMPLRAS